MKLRKLDGDTVSELMTL